jgi:hypothetical protein
MPKQPPPTIQKALKLHYSLNDRSIWLTEQNTLRKLIGILGICLPVLLFLVLLIDSGWHTPLYSISHYYFTRACGVFEIIVGTLGIFLLVYKGKEPIDFYFSSIAGISALTLLLFPTDNISGVCRDPDHLYSLTILRESDFRSNFHYISAAIFLSGLAFMSIFLFTKSDKSPKQRGRQKRRRNRVYRTCGVIMIIAMLVILAKFLRLVPAEVFTKYHLTFWMETIAVWSFGISWLTKAEVFLSSKQ